MARELSQEALLDFLCQAGGRVTNAALLGHFKSFLRDPAVPPALRERRRELFKGFVNSVAAVRQDPDGTKCVVLRRRYRDLVGEGPGRGAPQGAPRRGARPDPAAAQDQPGTPSREPPDLPRRHPAPPARDRPEQVTSGTPSPETPHLPRRHPAPPARDRPERLTSGTPSREPPDLPRRHPAPPARDRPEQLTSGTPNPETPHLPRRHPAPPARDRPEQLTSGTPSPETPHLPRRHPAPPARDRPERLTSGTPSPEPPDLPRRHPAPPARDRPERLTSGTPSREPPDLPRRHPAPPARDRPEQVTSGTPSPETPHLPRRHPAPPARDRPEQLTSGTPSPETPHLPRRHPAPPARDRPERLTSGTPSPEPPDLPRRHPAPPARDRPEQLTSGTPNPETPHLPRRHPAPPARDRPEQLTSGTPNPETPHLPRRHPAPPARDRPEQLTSGTPSPETPHLPRRHPAPPARDRPERLTSGTPSPEPPDLPRHHPAPPARDRPEQLTSGTPSPEPPDLPRRHPAPPARDRREPDTPSHPETAHLQLQRTREWVARHQMPELRDQGPVRAWSVLPDDFFQLHSEPGFSAWETAPPEPPLSSGGLFPEVPAECWPGKPAPAVFRSIRCQLSLQDLDDFVDQESHSSEESSSGPKESPGGSEEGLQAAPGAPDLAKSRNLVGGLSVSPAEGTTSPRPQDPREGSQPSKQAPPGEPVPWPAPRARRSLSSRARKATLSSSDEECLGEDLLKRTRRPPRPRRPSKAGAVPSPRVDAALTPKLAGIKPRVAEPGRPHSWRVPNGEGPAALVLHRPFEHKSSLVPLEAREHEWIVKLASGSWIQVLALFWEDPQLALHRDFLTGYTALHWIAKHGSLRALQDLVLGAQKTGIVLDVNVKSSCGYTPLHLAAMHGHQGVIKLLVQRLASRVNVRDSSGKKPWQYLASNTSGEIRQLLGAPQDKPIFPVHPLVPNSSPTRKTKSREISRNVTRKTSLAALLKNQHNKWKLANHREKFPTAREKEEYSD